MRKVESRGPRRFEILDLARGIGVAAMVVYHFFVDLRTLGFARYDLSRDPFWGGWQAFRTGIVTVFLCVTGASLYLAYEHGIDWRKFLRRTGCLLGAAIIVTLATELAVPGRTPWMGMLQSIALMGILALPFRRLGAVNVPLGAAAILVGATVSLPYFNKVPLQAIGLMTYFPATEDYVPILPWFGVVLIGLFWGQVLSRTRAVPEEAGQRLPSPARRFLSWAGRHSLMIYLLHQPLLFGTLFLIKKLSGES